MAEHFDQSTVRASLEINAERFNRNYVRFQERDVSHKAMALLSFVKINAGEAYGVEVTSQARAHLWELPDAVYQVEKLVAREEDFESDFRRLFLSRIFRASLQDAVIKGGLVIIGTRLRLLIPLINFQVRRASFIFFAFPDVSKPMVSSSRSRELSNMRTEICCAAFMHCNRHNIPNL
ncbi:MAG: hypothetical protein GY822_21525 [Deltaproteobacteria bacterium]|nr:hypothetical protein [Deltaproteobacteria bacterium]